MIAGQLEIQMSMNLARLSDDVQKAKTTVSRGMDNISKSVDVAKKALGALGIGLGLNELKNFVMASIDAADAMNDMAQKVGINVKTLASYELAVKQNGGSIEMFGVGMKNLSVYMAKNSDQLRSLGVTSKDTGTAFNQLSDVFHAMPDGYLKTALAQEIFKKSGVDMIPVLNQGSAGLEQAAAKSALYAQRMAIAAPISDQFNDRLAELKISYSGMLALSTAPVFNELIKGMLDAKDKSDSLKASFDPLGETLKALIVFGGNFVYTWARIGNELGARAAQMVAISNGNFAGAGAISAKLEQDNAKALSDFNAWEQKILAVKTGMNAVDVNTGTASESAAANVNKLEDAVKKLLTTGTSLKKFKQSFDPEGDFWFAVDEAALKNHKAARDEMYKQQAAQEEKQKQDAIQKQSDMWKTIDSTAQQTFVSIFDSGKSAFDRLRDTLKNGLYALLYEMTVKKFIIQLSTAISGTGVASQAFGASAMGAGVSSSLFGTAAVAATGTAAATPATAGLLGVGGAAAMTPAMIAGAAVVGGLLLAKYGFGFGNSRENVGPQRLVGNFNRAGFTGNYAQDWKVEGGIFGGGSSGTELTALTDAQTKAYKQTVDTLQKTFNTLGDTIGYASVKTQDWTVKINQAGDVTGALADGMGRQLIPSLVHLQMAGENLAQTAQRVNDAFTSTTQLISGLGLGESSAFGSIGIASADARLALVDAAGGLQNFTALAGQFSGAILTPAQQLQVSLDAVGQTFAQLGISGIETNQQFADLVKSELQLGHYDVVTKLLGVSAAFGAVTQAAKDTTQALLDTISTDSFKTMVDYQRAIGRATNAAAPAGSIDASVAAAAAQLPALQASNAAQAIKDAKANALAAMQAAGKVKVQGGRFINLGTAQQIGDSPITVSSRGGTITPPGYNLPEVQAYIAARDYYNSLPSYAVGTSYVPHDMTANIHRGERILSASSNDALLAELHALRDQVSKLLLPTEATANYVKKTSDLLRNVTRDGESLLTTAA